MTPKSLLRHPDARSSFDKMSEGTSFLRVIPDEEVSKNPENVKRLIFCSGKVYYELIKERNTRGLDKEMAISRIEQLFPFPWDLVSEEIQKYPNADIIYSQEEHKNQGYWSFIEPHVECILKHLHAGGKEMR